MYLHNYVGDNTRVNNRNNNKRDDMRVNNENDHNIDGSNGRASIYNFYKFDIRKMRILRHTGLRIWFKFD